MKRVIVPGMLLLFVPLVLVAARHWTARPVAAAPNHPPASMAAMMGQAATSTPGIIDGSVNPELIPDSAAYRLFFLAASDGGPSPTPQQAARQKAVLFAAGVRDPSTAQVVTILASFRTQYTTLVANYNTSWYVTHGSTAGLASFLADRDALVQSTRDQLKASLGTNTMAAFDQKVQTEKVHMKVAEAEAQQ